MSKLIEIKDLVTNFYTYEGVVKALNKISLDIDKGITFGLVGESGCGKSVTVRSIMRIVQSPGKIESGQIFFHEENNGSTSDSEPVDLLLQTEKYMRHLRGNKISMIFQEPNAALNPILSIGAQVSESFLFHKKKEMAGKILEHLSAEDDTTLPLIKPFLRFAYTKLAENPQSGLLKLFSRVPVLKLWETKLKQEARRRSVEIIEKLAIPNARKIFDSFPHNLSGGMKQRIVIAIALACSPVLLIADEATSNLDVTIQAQILELLNTLKNDIISSILLITHDLGVVAETCDRVGVMYAGSLCEVADVKELFHNPRHPYTKALLNSVPKRAQAKKLETIEGSVPNLVTPPTGCRFHPRCSLAMEKCKQKTPQIMDKGNGHMVACYAAA
ncbi:MAG: ABC transporter ATP-binding protein [Deltaproteobacteria bacterium]|nr:ABC transporter ATP-binding protein [Deltaproteobacteria bacterium]